MKTLKQRIDEKFKTIGDPNDDKAIDKEANRIAKALQKANSLEDVPKILDGLGVEYLESSYWKAKEIHGYTIAVNPSSDSWMVTTKKIEYPHTVYKKSGLTFGNISYGD